VIRCGRRAGRIGVEAASEGLKPATAALEVAVK
jgi:hypothetical protein